jgi:hypothetical protein
MRVATEERGKLKRGPRINREAQRCMRNTPENPNETLLLSAAEKSAPLLNRIAFVGGCATGLLVTDPAADPVRRTLDVDAIVAVASYRELISLEESLRQCGFHESIEDGAPRCR